MIRCGIAAGDTFTGVRDTISVYCKFQTMATVSTHARPKTRSRSLWARIALAAVGLYFIGLAVFYYAMCQTPETFGNVMKHTGPVPFLVYPFETMWNKARAGTVHVGDAAPDFTLPLLDHSGAVTLSSLRGSKPVVLVFGSYT